jgi:hypothetical protein
VHQRGETVSVLTWDVRKERQMVFVVVRRRLISLFLGLCGFKNSRRCGNNFVKLTCTNSASKNNFSRLRWVENVWSTALVAEYPQRDERHQLFSRVSFLT